MNYISMAENDFQRMARSEKMNDIQHWESNLVDAWYSGYQFFVDKLVEKEMLEMREWENMMDEVFNETGDEVSKRTFKETWIDGYVTACSYYYEEVRGKGKFKRMYKVRGRKEVLDKIEDKRMFTHIETVDNDEAEFWGVYEIQDDGTEEWLADFREYEDAQMFALEKEEEEVK